MERFYEDEENCLKTPVFADLPPPAGRGVTRGGSTVPWHHVNYISRGTDALFKIKIGCRSTGALFKIKIGCQGNGAL